MENLIILVVGIIRQSKAKPKLFLGRFNDYRNGNTREILVSVTEQSTPQVMVEVPSISHLVTECEMMIQSHLYSDIKKMYGNDTFVR